MFDLQKQVTLLASACMALSNVPRALKFISGNLAFRFILRSKNLAKPRGCITIKDRAEEGLLIFLLWPRHLIQENPIWSVFLFYLFICLLRPLWLGLQRWSPLPALRFLCHSWFLFPEPEKPICLAQHMPVMRSHYVSRTSILLLWTLNTKGAVLVPKMWNMCVHVCMCVYMYAYMY